MSICCVGLPAEKRGVTDDCNKKRETQVLDLDVIEKTPLTRSPFKFFVAPGVLSAVDLAAIRADFPKIDQPGLFPLSELSFGPRFAKLVEEAGSPEFERILEQKFDVSLSNKPLMITVRSISHQRDGRIHTDSKSKVLTCLIYLNNIWDESGGRLRFLRASKDLGDYVAEIPPDGGTLTAFLRSDQSWHGHEPYVGPRRCLMLTWMASRIARARDVGRHTISARFKRSLSGGREA